ncbi:MAG: hypothetical protein V7603_3472 [Micromonosporaceae bacterium]|jgi:hypothetical protein
MSVSDVDTLPWFKSSYSAGNGACVEVAFVPGVVAMRDSKDPYGPTLRFGAEAWRDFVASVRGGAFDLNR